MSHTETKAYHHGNLRGALVEAGLEILELEGPSALSLRAVARRAGVSHAAPAHHFATLGHLLAEMAAQGFTAFVSSLDAAAAQGKQDAVSRLKAMGRAYVMFAVGRPSLYALMFRTNETIVWTDHLEQAASAAWSQLAEAVAPVLKRDAQDPLTRSGAVRVWSLVHGFASLSIDNRFPPNVRGEVNPDIMEDAIATLPVLAKGVR